MIVNPGIRRFLGSAIQRLFNSASFYAPLTHTAVPDEAATGTTATFTRATTKTVENNDGYLVTGVAGEIGFVGARRVRNLLTYTEDFSNAVWIAGEVTKTATTITETAATADHSVRYTIAAGKNVAQIKVKPNGRTRCAIFTTGNTNKSAIFNLTTVEVEGPLTDFPTLGDSPTITLQSDGYYLLTMGNLSGGTTLMDFYLLNDVTTSRSYAGDITKGMFLKHAQLEDVTAQTTQTAGEYVSVGVESAPYYHGSFVDGVKCFDTDLAGNALTTMLGYQAEGARTNLCLQSQTFGTTWWPDGSTSVAENQYVAPDGTISMDKITTIAVTSQHYLKQAITFSASATTYSCYLRYVNNRWAALVMSNGGGILAASFDLLNGVTGAVGVGTTSTIQPTEISGVYRVSITGTMSAGVGNIYISPNATNTASLENYTSAGTETVGAWGAQVELGSFASSYIATTTIAVTRNADVLTYSSAGNILGTAGWAYAEITLNGVTNVADQSIVGTDLSGRILEYDGTTSTRPRMYDGTNITQAAAGTSAINRLTKVAGTWGGTTARIVTDTTTVVNGTFDGTMSTATAIGVGCFAAGGNQLDGTMRNVRIGQRQLSSSELQAVTR